jgi:hypothetical protein
MAIDVSKLSEKVFKALKSYQLSLTLYTDTGESTVSPSEATRFYNEENNIMVNLELSQDIYKLKVNIGNKNDINDIRPLLDILKNIAKTYNIQYFLRTYNKKITPKDFSYQSITKPVTEGFTKPWGTVKTSRRKFENATLYIKHSKRVDEQKRGSRSRNIKSMFIENSEGERFKFPYKNISAAKSMCIHINEGGTPYDEAGRAILNITKEHEQLKEYYFKVTKQGSLNENATLLIEKIKDRIFELKTKIKSMNSKSGYKNFFENYSENVSESDFSVDILQEYDIVSEDINEEVIPYLKSIAHNLKESTEKEKSLEDFFKQFANGKEFIISSPIVNTDPDNPVNLKFNDIKSRLSSLSGYLSTLASDQDTSNYLRQLSDDVYRFGKKHIDFAEKLLTFLKNYAKVNSDLEIKKESISESAVNKVIKELNKFDL